MSKQVTISTEDNLSITDKTNFKSITEKTFDKFNVDLEKVKFNGLKAIQKEWYSNIVEIAINSIKEKPNYYKFNKESNSFICNFNSQKENEIFLKEFQKYIYKATNKFLEDKNLNIKHYNRILIFETQQNELTLNIRF